MTNFEKYKKEFTVDIFIRRMIMDCRYCPLKNGCKILTRKDCEATLRRWCEKEAE